MSFLQKTIGFMAVLMVIPSVWAATARPSIIAQAGARMPTMTTQISGGSTTTTTGQTTAEIDRECIDAYTECLKAADVCGPNFEECTNKTLFYSKRPMCASNLMQCRTTAVNSLFGTATQTAFSNKNTNGEYVYPTNGSILGQMIEAAHISNRYDTSTCVRRYTSCLKKDDVCGADFELCTSGSEFKKQKLFCESTLARCQDGGLKELFGTTNTSTTPMGDSRIGIMISEGAALAAVNAVATCYKVVDQCILNTCATNPYKCKEGSDQEVVQIVETINNPDGSVTTKTTDNVLGAINRNQISAFIRNACLDTVGGNKFCYATFLGNGAMPTASQLMDEDNKTDIYAEAYSSRMNESMKTKIDDLIEKFDRKTKTRCQDTIINCAMRSCGGGSGLACYNLASSGTANNATIDITKATNSIRSGCEAIVNTDTACKYAGAKFQANIGVLDFLDNSLFDQLFTSSKDTDVTNPDPVGAVAALNTRLAQSYSPTAMTEKTKQCKNTARACVTNMCGEDFTGCYRNRTDIFSDITETGQAALNKSMNKVGGVLDRTIIVGLCMDTVKNSPVCDELIMANAYKAQNDAVSNGGAIWGDSSSVRAGWLDAGKTAFDATDASYQDQDADGNPLCTASTAGCGSSVGVCNTAFMANRTSCLFDTPVMISAMDYSVNLASNKIFQEVVNDLEMQAQAEYNRKLTQQQNMCMSGNASGGVMGVRDLGGTYQWVKLKNNKVPTAYPVDGLKSNQFVTSNELYGSFCRIRITLQSDDKKIQEEIRNGSAWSTAYFAAGDPFTCGSWIPEDVLNRISNTVAAEKTGTNADGKAKNGQGWLIAGMSVLGTVGGGLGMDALQNGSLGGLLGTNKTKKMEQANQSVNSCRSALLASIQQLQSVQNNENAIKGKQVVQASPVTGQNGQYIWTYTLVNASEANANPSADINAKIAEMQDNLENGCGTPQTASEGTNWGRIGVDALGGAIGGVTLGVGTAQIIKASNRSKFTAAQQEWMDNVGSHIRCYIGPEEVGTYGDMITTELE